MELLRLGEAAERLGISYPTLKQWIYQGKIHSVKTAGGHHRISTTEIDSLLFQGSPRRSAKPKPATGGASSRSSSLGGLESVSCSGLDHVISGRNQLVGRVTHVETVGLLSKVTIDVGGQTVTAIITRDACDDLGLRVGDAAAALIKATEVMVVRPAQSHATPPAGVPGRKR